MNIILTGGLGYIGSHTCISLSKNGHEVLIYDNLSNSKKSTLKKLELITRKKINFIEGDVLDTKKFEKALKKYNIDSVIHFAGLKSVGESSKMPLEYFDSNINGMISVLKAMKSQRVKRLVFSSSATVYGEPEYLPLDENHVTRAINPYGRCKLHIEEILSDLSKSDSEWDIVCLRYFNPAGAHTSSLIGEDPRDEPTNLMPIIAQVANGEIPYINIFGSDYDTKDGTGVRDYIHVMDLADGHVAALNYLSNNSGWSVINLGTGIGYSVLEMIKTYEKVSGKKIKYKFVDKRAGDTATCYAKVDRALKFLRWEAKYNLTDMCFSSWEFKKKYPL